MQDAAPWPGVVDCIAAGAVPSSRRVAIPDSFSANLPIALNGTCNRTCTAPLLGASRTECTTMLCVGWREYLAYGLPKKTPRVADCYFERAMQTPGTATNARPVWQSVGILRVTANQKYFASGAGRNIRLLQGAICGVWTSFTDGCCDFTTSRAPHQPRGLGAPLTSPPSPLRGHGRVWSTPGTSPFRRLNLPHRKVPAARTAGLFRRAIFRTYVKVRHHLKHETVANLLVFVSWQVK